MNDVYMFGVLEIIASAVYFLITGLCSAKRRHIKAYTGLKYYALTMGIWDLCQGIYYISPYISIALILVIIVYSVIPFAYLFLFMAVWQYSYPERKGKFFKYLFIVPILTVILAMVNKYNGFFQVYDKHFYFDIKDIKVMSDYLHGWLIVYMGSDIILLALSFIVLVKKFFALIKKGRKLEACAVFFISVSMIFKFLLMVSLSRFLFWVTLWMKLCNIIIVYVAFYYDEEETLVFRGRKDLIEQLPFPVVIRNNKDKIIFANSRAVKVCPDIKDFASKDLNYNEAKKYFSLYDLANTIESDDFKGGIRHYCTHKESGELFFLKTNEITDKNKKKVRGRIDFLITVSSMQLFIKNLEALAFKDNLCSVYNRHYFDIKKKEYASDNSILPLSLLICDIDNLKRMNDNLGHETGDSYILSACKTIRAHIRKSDYIFRVGGDEFIVMLEGASYEIACNIASSIMDNFHFENKNNYETGISIGCVTATTRPIDFESLIKEGDDRMYEIKKSHKEIRNK